MRHAILIAILTACAVTVWSNYGWALNCSNPQTQMEMNQCAQDKWQEADAALNAAYKSARTFFKNQDESQPDNAKVAAAALLAAQRSWIGFRDAHCETEGFKYFGGSMRPMIIATCMEDLTRQRTKQLKALVVEP